MSESLSLVGEFPAPRALVFRAFADPDELRAWFWPPRFGTASAVDLRKGGSYFLRSAVVGIGFSGRYIEVSAPTSLAFDWTWDGEPLTTSVRLEFEEAGMTARLCLSHSGFDTTKQRDDHVQGWNDCLDRLEIYLARIRA